MDKVLFFLSLLGALIVLCQWYVFVSIRKYLCGLYDPITRRVAYPVLGLLGLSNFIGLKTVLEFTGKLTDNVGQEIAAVAFFSYLGLVLVLSLFFLMLHALDHIIQVKNAVPALIDWLRGVSKSLTRSEKGRLATTLSASAQVPGKVDSTQIDNEKAASAGIVSNKLLCTAGHGAEHDPEAPSLTRRTFLKWGTAAGLAAGVGFAGKGIAEAYRKPLVEEFDFFHPGLEGLAQPLKLIHLTDFHFGMFYGSRDLEQLVETVNSIEGDAVVLTGDTFHSPMSPIELATPLLKQLRPRRLGNFAVLGNHDFYAGVNRSVASLEKAALNVLRNEWVTFHEENAFIHLGGVDDPMGNWLWGKQFPQFASFMKKYPVKPGVKIVLSHRPNIFPAASHAGIDLVLAGHTHGGQIILPGISEKRGYSLARVVSPFTHGWYRMHNSRMYLNRGIGLTFVPWRINCPPEIAVLRLTGKDPQRSPLKISDV